MTATSRSSTSDRRAAADGGQASGAGSHSLRGGGPPCPGCICKAWRIRRTSSSHIVASDRLDGVGGRLTWSDTDPDAYGTTFPTDRRGRSSDVRTLDAGALSKTVRLQILGGRRRRRGSSRSWINSHFRRRSWERSAPASWGRWVSDPNRPRWQRTNCDSSRLPRCVGLGDVEGLRRAPIPTLSGGSVQEVGGDVVVKGLRESTSMGLDAHAGPPTSHPESAETWHVPRHLSGVCSRGPTPPCTRLR